MINGKKGKITAGGKGANKCLLQKGKCNNSSEA